MVSNLLTTKIIYMSFQGILNTTMFFSYQGDIAQHDGIENITYNLDRLGFFGKITWLNNYLLSLMATYYLVYIYPDTPGLIHIPTMKFTALIMFLWHDIPSNKIIFNLETCSPAWCLNSAQIIDIIQLKMTICASWYICRPLAQFVLT